ncbi:hypothetical protein CHLV4088_03540 [Campylobacter helveticus]|uniref:FIST N-terminal domain-containing protein n=1 Tax=Campylobacter helveticus TaxID=28898 RepID=UPI002149C52F|nr:FIST N-terminal domain-containing protein [Campylobacter helveticus]MCR2056477.1 hypothetical protein [Campylobacter helveticus]
MPNADFANFVREIKAVLPPSCTLIMASSAGLLCSMHLDSALPKFYGEGMEGVGASLMLFAEEMIEDIHIVRLNLGTQCANSKEQIALIEKEIQNITPPPFKVEHHNTLAYTLIDGLSGAESFLMSVVCLACMSAEVLVESLIFKTLTFLIMSKSCKVKPLSLM